MTATGRRRVIILGSGPAAYTAAIYAGRAELAPLVLAGSGTDTKIGIPGGQLMLTTDVENAGIPRGRDGPEMMDLFASRPSGSAPDRRRRDRVGSTVDRSGQAERPTRRRAHHRHRRRRQMARPGVGEAPEPRGLGLRHLRRALYRGKIGVVGGSDTAVEKRSSSPASGAR
jgi:hypothetical protein